MATQTETQVLSSTWEGQNDLIKNPAQTSPSTVPRNVDAELGYYRPPKDGGPARPVNIKTDKKFNERDWQPTTVYDVRGSSVTHTLDTTGFQYVNHKSAVKDFSDDAIVKDAYYTEMSDLLRKM